MYLPAIVIGEGEGAAEVVGEGDGEAVGVADGDAETVGVGVGEGVGVGDAETVGVGEGVGVGDVVVVVTFVGVPEPGQVCERRIPESLPLIRASDPACTIRIRSETSV